jgi:hypothetical protein
VRPNEAHSPPKKDRNVLKEMKDRKIRMKSKAETKAMAKDTEAVSKRSHDSSEEPCFSPD